jgi:acetyl esterase/lipase
MKRILLLLGFCFFAVLPGLVAEEPKTNAGDPYARLSGDWKVVKDIVFKQVGDQKFDLLLLLPAERKFEKAPLVVFIHGGGFGGGDKFHVLRRDALGVARGLTQRGVAFASIEYRLTKPGVTVNESVADCKDAVHFLVKHAAEYNLDPERIGTFGESAGGNLTLTTALGSDHDYPCDPTLTVRPVKIRCVAAYYGPVSFIDPALRKGSNFEFPVRLLSILGGPLEEKGDLAKKLSPIELLRPDSPPIFLAHGDADKVIGVQNTLSMRDAAQAKGVPMECVISKGAGHGFGGEAIDPSIAEINMRTVDFFLKYLTAP